MRPARLLSSKLKSFYDVVSKHTLQNGSFGVCVTQRQPFSSTERKYGITAAYDTDGKTYGKILNKGSSPVLLIDSMTERGFRLINSFHILGPTIIFPHAILSWNVESAADINEDSLSLFTIMEPKIDMLIIGFGEREHYTKEVQLNVFKACKNLKLNFEAMTTENAVSTFNFLSYDRRYVAAALIPPINLSFFGMDDEVNRQEVLEFDMNAKYDPTKRPKKPEREPTREEIRKSLVGSGQ